MPSAGHSSEFLALPRLFEGEFVGDVVLVNIPDVGDGFLSNVFFRHQLDIIVPDIGVETHAFSLPTQSRNPTRPSVIASKYEHSFVDGIYFLVLEISISNVPQHLYSGMNIAVCVRDVRNIDRRRGGVLRYHLHDADGTARAPSVLI